MTASTPPQRSESFVSASQTLSDITIESVILGVILALPALALLCRWAHFE